MADDYFNGFGGGDALREALRLAMTPNRLADGQMATQDFAPQPQPRDEHGFLFSRVGGDLKFNPYEAVKNFMGYRAPPGALSTSGDDTPIRSAADVAGWVGMSGLGLNAFGAVPANALGSAGAKAPQALSEALRSSAPRVENPIRAYHGSPHDFDRFDLSKIGTGEGAQAFGHGLYFAENEGVAKNYKHDLSPMGKTVDRRELSNTHVPDIAAELLHRTGGDRETAIRMARNYDWQRRRDNRTDGASYQDVARVLEQLAETPLQKTGHMYEVAIHASPDQFLDWDKPLSQQSEAVRRALETLDPNAEKRNRLVQLEKMNQSGDGTYASRRLQMRLQQELANDAPMTNDPRGEELAKALSTRADRRAEMLQDAGIPGIRYLDQGSRDVGDGTRNLVVFDPNLIEILRKYGLLGPVAAGATSNALMGDKNDQ